MIYSKLLKKFIRYYAIFALLNVFYKQFSQYYLRLKARRLWKHLPGKDCDPKATNLRKYAAKYSIHDYFANNSLDYIQHDIAKQDTPLPSLMFNSPRAIKWMLKDEFVNVTKPSSSNELFSLMREFLGDTGIFNLQHGQQPKFREAQEMWHSQRKVASLIFTKSNFMTLFHDTFSEKSEIFIKRLEQEEGNVVDLQELFFSFTMDSIEKFFMGTEVNTIEGGMSPYAKAFDGAHSAMMQIMRESMGFNILARNFLPFPFGTLTARTADTKYSLIMQMYRMLSPTYREFRNNIRKLDAHVYKYIKKTRQAKDLKDRKDIIANFLNSKIGPNLSDQTLRDIVLCLTIAGRDTTACALSWMFFELTQNQEVQQKLIEEINAVLKGEAPTLENLSADNLPYLNGVMYETLRLHPPVPNESKEVIEDTTYIDGTVIPARTPLFFNPRAIGRNPERFPDPLKFDPTRWIPFKQPSLYEFPVFQAGPRFCLGKDMAQYELKLLSVKLLQKFKFTLKEGESKKVRYSLMLTNSIAVDEERKSFALYCRAHKH